MKRNCSLDEISDGKLYEINDLVKLGCNDCEGCSSCCMDMGNSIILDPLDIHRLLTGLDITFEQLLANNIELNVVDGIILPNLKMAEGDNKCSFLNDIGRCSIHSIRPSICRIFPLGRYYTNNSFKYFLQVNECDRNKTKVKIKKWIDVDNIARNDKYIVRWHYFLNDVEELIKSSSDDSFIKNINLYCLNNFYIKAYDKNEDFYMQFNERLEEAVEALGIDRKEV